ncbi:MAG: Na/Pi symporter [Sneathiella sp.]|nr:Na/Pi symporter [Sneathiella sp.]
MFEQMGFPLLLAAGGLGLFMLGMLILTEGLKGLAGNALRRWLASHTTSPTAGAVSGALTTAVIQSSSATTVMAVGFVGAGLLTFPQSLGIIFGANIGTTITGWIVAVGGFKLELGYIALPLLLIGIMLKMFAPGRWSHFGWTLAGFSLLFIGIETIQQGLLPFEGVVTPQDFPSDTYFGRFLLVLIGIAITLVTQSSSAGVATALVALSTGAISFPQAAAMVIGMDVGTTFTAVLATIGGSTAMRQTGYAHVIYNIMTGVMAFLLLGPVTDILSLMIENGRGNQQIGLVAFHSFFNVLGVLLILPTTRIFATFIQRLVPETDAPLVGRLDERLLVDLDTASVAAITTTRDITLQTLSLLHALLTGTISDWQSRKELVRLTRALETTRSFVAKMRSDPLHANASERLRHALHSLDHLSRLINRCRQLERVATLPEDRRLARLSRLLDAEIRSFCRSNDWAVAAKRFDRLRDILRRQRRTYREKIVVTATAEGSDPVLTLAKLDSLRWLHRVCYHTWRIIVHLDAVQDTGNAATATDTPVQNQKAKV